MASFVAQRLRAFDGIEVMTIAAGVLLSLAVALFF
jgi:hypothetical protein